MKSEVFYRKNEKGVEIAIRENGKVEHYYKFDDVFFTGSIFVGKVVRVNKNLGAFVDIGLEKDGLLSFREGLKVGDYVLVAVTKEPSENKGCALSENVSIAGRFTVVENSKKISFSSKITSEKKKELLEECKKRDISGVLFRSLCENVSVNEIFDEYNQIKKELDLIKQTAKNTQKIACLYSDDALKIAKRFADCDDDLIIGFNEIEREIKNIGERKIETDGVEIVFDKTEALTAVDVNYHRFGGNAAGSEEAIYRANCLAVAEIARQIRLRNVGGIIMVDFISMKNPENVEKLEKLFKEELALDNVKTSVELVKSIGMFAVTRKRRYGSV